MAVLGLRFCVRAFSSCGKWGPFFIAVRGPLIIVASLVAEHGLQTRRLSNCGSRAQLLRGMWDLPRPGLEPVSSALAGRFSTTAPPGKPCSVPFKDISLRNCILSLITFMPSLDSLCSFWAAAPTNWIRFEDDFIQDLVSWKHCTENYLYRRLQIAII